MEHFTDDSSRRLGLNHGATLRSGKVQSDLERKRAEREAFIKRLDARQRSDREEYLREIGLEPDEADVQQFREAGLSVDAAREAAINKKLSAPLPGSSDGEVGRRMQKYVDAGYSTLDAIDAAEAEMAAEEAVGGDYLGASVEALMKAPVDPKGSGSKSKGRSSNRQPDSVVVAQAILRMIA